jgi:hypothetical protein
MNMRGIHEIWSFNGEGNVDIDLLVQGWANFFVGGPNEKSKISCGPT